MVVADEPREQQPFSKAGLTKRSYEVFRSGLLVVSKRLLAILKRLANKRRNYFGHGRQLCVRYSTILVMVAKKSTILAMAGICESGTGQSTGDPA